ncbi:hypothetical protein WG904_05940 [Pedobacter sp. Du54]|uniref:hypothetical protein n=1 Tax=Pedobacter anseongensis TaxID=3133439 RepID=UPI00309998EB
MKTKYLFPKWCSIIGYILAIPGFILGYFCVFNNFEITGFGFRIREKDYIFEKAFENFTNELAIFLVIIGLLLIAFSKNKKEDELNSKIRLNSLYWGVLSYYIVYILLFCITAFLTEIYFLNQYYLELNIFTPLLIFIARFNYLKYIKKDVYLIDRPFLLPNWPTKKLGIIITFLAIVLFVTANISEQEEGKYYQLFYLSFITGLLLWVFSKYKNEDEMVNMQRLESLQLAVYFNYSLLLIATLFTYSLNFLTALAIANFSLLLFFVVRMEYVNYKNNLILNTFEGEFGS